MATAVSKRAFLASNVFSILSNQIPFKYKDPSCPPISILIGGQVIHRALLDLGASVNLLPLTVYKILRVGELTHTKIVLQLANKSTRVPRGVVEDVLIKVGEFIFPVDFVVLDTERVPNVESHIPVILGFPFLATSNARINCRNGIMKLSFGNMTLDSNIFNMQRQSDDFDDMDHSTLNWVSDFSYDELEFEHVDESAAEYESFFMTSLSMMCLTLTHALWTS